MPTTTLIVIPTRPSRRITHAAIITTMGKSTSGFMLKCSASALRMPSTTVGSYAFMLVFAPIAV